MNPDDLTQIQRLIDASEKRIISFQTRKLGDTPTDSYQLTPQKYVNMNGSVASRPIGSVANFGQFYMATDTGIPMFFTSNRNWVNGVGSVVARN